MTNIDIARIAGARAGNLIKRAVLGKGKTESTSISGGGAPHQPFKGDPFTTPKSIEGPMDPTLKAGLIGSLLGAGVGGLGNAAFGNRKKSLLARLGIGAGIGGVAGGLGGAGINELGLRHSMDTDAFGPDARSKAVTSGSSPMQYLESLMRGPKITPQEHDPSAEMYDAIQGPPSQEKYSAHGLYTNRQTGSNKAAMDGSRTPSDPIMQGPTDNELGRIPGLVNSNMGGGRGISDSIRELYRKNNFDNPMGTNAAIGAGIGGVAGGLGNALFGSRKRSLLARLGLGALGGAAAGGGIGAGAGYLNSSPNAGQKGSPGFDPNDDQNMGTAHNYLNQYEAAMAPFRALKAKMDAARQDAVNVTPRQRALETMALEKLHGKRSAPDSMSPQIPTPDNTVENSPEWESRNYHD